MGKPTRPASAITYEQAEQYENSHTKWFTFHGQITHVAELAEAFGVNHITLIKRLEARWPLEAALIADPKKKWTYHTIQYLQNDPATKTKIVAVINSFFAPISRKNKKGNNGVIDGGHF